VAKQNYEVAQLKYESTRAGILAEATSGASSAQEATAELAAAEKSARDWQLKHSTTQQELERAQQRCIHWQHKYDDEQQEFSSSRALLVALQQRVREDMTDTALAAQEAAAKLVSTEKSARVWQQKHYAAQQELQLAQVQLARERAETQSLRQQLAEGTARAGAEKQ